MQSDAGNRPISPLLSSASSGARSAGDVARRRKSGLYGPLWALLFVTLAGALRYLLAPVIGPKTVYMMFYPAIMLSAWFGGLAGGAAAVVLSALIVTKVFSPPLGISLSDSEEVGSLIAFVVVGSGIVWGKAALRASREKLAGTAEALAEKEARFQALFDILPVGISIAEDPECKEIRHNPTFAQWLGHPPGINASLMGPHAGELPYQVRHGGKVVRPEDLPMSVAARTGQAYHDWEGEVVTADGRVIHILGYASPLLGADGKVEGCLGTYVDITELRQAEQERAAHQAEIETLNHRLQRAMSETHHRVKNNLQVITALLNMEILRHETAVPAEHVGRVIHHVQSLAVIHDMLTQQSKVSALDQQISSRQALEKLIPLVAGLAAGRRIDYEAAEIDLTPRQGAALAILVNELISNAIKHGRGDIHVTFTAGERDARLVVEDGGPGFTAGFDADQAASTGLELVEMLARWDLQGETRYENRPEGGARVTVEFPT